MATSHALAVVAALACFGMALVWWRAERRRDASSVDVAWTLGIGGGALFAAVITPGDGLRRGLIAAATLGWSLRLALHLVRRLSHEAREDARYAELRTRWGERASRNFFAFFQIQAWLVLGFTVPSLAAQQGAPSLRAIDVLGVAVVLASLFGEAIADRQLARFKARPASRGETCREGLWAWSRHPNYFFEWTHWLAYPILAWGGELFWASLLGPLLMSLFLWKVTGIPATEARALVTRGDDYRRYQRETSAFFPWPPRRVATHPAEQRA
jgi:steroid 5-alpha reductase family enzyme